MLINIYKIIYTIYKISKPKNYIILPYIYLYIYLSPNNGYKEVVFKNCAAFTDCVSKINNIQIDNGRDIDV